MPSAFTPIVTAAIWRDFPDYRALSVTARGFRPIAPSPVPAPLTPPAWMDAHLESWRTAFRHFGANPKKTPSSVEALWKRVAKAGELPSIDPLVDLYNALSIRFGAPFGGEDADCYQGVPQLTLASGLEPFDTVREGAPVIESAEPNEIVWRDGLGITCRRWNWRQCKRTALTPATTNLWFIIDRLPPMPVEELFRAGEELVAGLRAMCPNVETAASLLELSK
jgi:DNA/RNA-binding domain of Phe-tRNA-synthetase-like protein